MLTRTREEVITAFWDRVRNAAFASPVSGVTSFRTTSRRARVWTDVPKDQRPALFLTERNESSHYMQENNPAINTLSCSLLIYTDASEPNSVPAVDLNVIADAIDRALDPGPRDERQTLGGLVSHCRVEGQVLKDPGDIDGDGLMIIPIRIRLT